ncbi:hypothetical protein EC968_000755 [Mortierella alpina]|nr:hypothetical protein EC968_000755 [Mortierella alpina]
MGAAIEIRPNQAFRGIPRVFRKAALWLIIGAIVFISTLRFEVDYHEWRNRMEEEEGNLPILTGKDTYRTSPVLYDIYMYIGCTVSPFAAALWHFNQAIKVCDADNLDGECTVKMERNYDYEVLGMKAKHWLLSKEFGAILDRNEIVVKLDDDTIISKDILDRLVREFSSSECVFAGNMRKTKEGYYWSNGPLFMVKTDFLRGRLSKGAEVLNQFVKAEDVQMGALLAIEDERQVCNVDLSAFRHRYYEDERMTIRYKPMSNQKTIADFKKKLKDQVIIPRAVVRPIAAQEERIYTGSNANPNNNGLQVLHTSKKRKTEVYSQPQDTGAGKHINSLLLGAINYLKALEDLKRKGNVDLEAKPELFDLLKSNEKVSYDTVTETFVYKPTYHIKNKEDLLTMLEKRKNEGGMEYKELKDSYSKLAESVKELSDEGRILVVRNKDGMPRVLYWNDVRYNTAMDQDFRDIWHKLRIPDEVDLPKELEKAGLTHMQVFDKKGPGETPKRKQVRRNRKMKITNTHMKDLDLTKDFVLPK